MMNLTITSNRNGNTVVKATTSEGLTAQVRSNDPAREIHFIAATLHNRLSAKGADSTYDEISDALENRTGGIGFRAH